MTQHPSLIKTKWGFYQYHPLPSQAELEDYYKKKYYQLGLGSYAVDYDATQILWWKNRANLIKMKAEQLLDMPNASVLDVGCGEGWLLSAFHSRGYKVQGFDFSIAGIAKWHPELLPHFSQGDIYNLLQEQVKRENIHDIIFLGNVIEHVLEPEKLLCSLHQLLSPSGILIIMAPNDFSDLQQLILDQGKIGAPWWLYYPDHISYFNKDTLCALANDMGFCVLDIMADFPIEFALLSGNSNYVLDKDLGPETHRRRLKIDNFLFGKSPSALLAIYEHLGRIGVGRNLVYFCGKEAF